MLNLVALHRLMIPSHVAVQNFRNLRQIRFIKFTYWHPNMSSQKGNLQRTRAQSHSNKTAFKNDIHHKEIQMKRINDLVIEGVCLRCKDIIAWRIKYRKYKPLTVPKKCTKCEQKTILRAYHVICDACATEAGVCGKCGKPDMAKDVKKTHEEEKIQKDKSKSERLSSPEEKSRTSSRSSDAEDTEGDIGVV